MDEEVWPFVARISPKVAAKASMEYIISAQMCLRIYIVYPWQNWSLPWILHAL